MRITASAAPKAPEEGVRPVRVTSDAMSPFFARSRAALRLVAMAAVVPALPACGGADPGETGGGSAAATTQSSGEGGATSGDGGSSSSGDGGASSTGTEAAATTGAGAGSPTYVGHGSVVFGNSQYDYGQGPLSTGFVSAVFNETIDAAVPCSAEAEGDCVYYRCGPNPDVGVYEPRSPGDISIVGANTAVLLELQEGGSYFFMHDDFVYYPSSMLTVTTTGDEVPAFTGTVQGPTHASITSPDLNELVVDGGEDLALAWTVAGPGSGLLLVAIGYYDQAADVSHAVNCEYDMATGSGTIPAGLLGQMPQTDQANMTFTDYAREQVEAGDWLITIAAQQNASADTPTGAAVATGVVLQ